MLQFKLNRIVQVFWLCFKLFTLLKLNLNNYMYRYKVCQHFHFVIQRTCTYLGSFFFRILHQIIESIMCNDLLTPIKLVMNCRRRLRLRKSRHRSMYRDIVFLAFVACGKENIDNGKDILVDKMYLGQILIF